ncbi:MAG TPA: hypothetical protein PK156_50350, partial [Polyangium sp.]|nr:hypothetical protein [Polyangium sp.]
VGCETSSKNAEPSEFEKKFTEYLEQNDFVVAALTIEDEIKGRGVDKVAPEVTSPILAKWAKAEESELETSARLGVDRALGRPKDYCGRCRAFREILDTLAPKSPELATRWKELGPKLEQAEKAAFDKESNDKRPIVNVWQQGSSQDLSALILISICVKESLERALPQYKWLNQTNAPPAEAAQFVLSGKTATDTYVDTRTQKEAANLLSGLRVVVTPRNVDATLSARFPMPLEAMYAVDSPETIRSQLPIGGPPTVETMKVGMDQIGRIKNSVCANLDKQIEKAAKSDITAPATSASASAPKKKP